MSLPTVGIVITCHNEAPWIMNTIGSARGQTTGAERIVVVDDGSTDDSRAILAPVAAAGLIKLLRITHRGMAAARNAGLMALDDCDWVVHLDGDDWLEPDFIAETLAHADGYDAVQTSVVRHTGRGWGTASPPPAPVDLTDLVERCTLHSCALFRREALVQIGGFRSDLGGDCDWGAWVELLARGARIAYCRTTAYHYRIRPGSMTTRETPADRARHHEMIRELA